MDRCVSNEKEPYIERKRALYSEKKSPIFQKALYGAVCRWIGVHQTKKKPIFREKEPYIKRKRALFSKRPYMVQFADGSVCMKRKRPLFFEKKETHIQRKRSLYSKEKSLIFGKKEPHIYSKEKSPICKEKEPYIRLFLQGSFDCIRGIFSFIYRALFLRISGSFPANIGLF